MIVSNNSLAELHRERDQESLDTALLRCLQEQAADVAVLIAIVDGDGQDPTIRVAHGSWPDRVRGDTWSRQDAEQASHSVRPLTYDGREVGYVAFGASLGESQQTLVDLLLLHYVTALANRVLDEEARQATDEYCATLQALEEGIVLFQEPDPEAVMARLLQLAGNMVDATASALYVLDEVGNADSGLRLLQSLGIPESLLETFVGTGDRAWPGDALDGVVELHRRQQDGSIAGLAAACAPPVLERVLMMPLRYHGVRAGICVLFNPKIDRGTEREKIGRLQSFSQLCAALLHRLSLERQREEGVSLAREIEIAETIQKRLVPQTAPQFDGFDFAWHTLAAKSIGGDYVDFVSSDLDELFAIVADASGHGVNSALLMTSFRANYRGSAPWLEPGGLAACLNNQVAQEVGPTGMFITAAMARLSPDTGELTICSAGHNPIMIYRAATGTIEQVDAHGPPMGFLAGCEYGEVTVPIAAGDALFLYTDGITEAECADEEMFGEERLEQLLLEVCPTGSAQQVLDTVLARLEAFTGKTAHEDDVSLMIVRRCADS
ncbi:MAG: PP2C family protein-serine/threonine phosphatase [Planctomycetota bacterium]